MSHGKFDLRGIILLLFLLSSSWGQASMLRSPSPASPQVGNGYLATFVNSSDVFLAGVFNGVGSSSQRAPFRATTRKFPKQFSTAPEPTVFDLDTRRGQVHYNSGGAVGPAWSANMTWYAHRTRPHLLVETITFESGQGALSNVSLVDFGDEGDSSSDYNSATSILEHSFVHLVVFPAAVSNTTPTLQGGVSFSSPLIPAAAQRNGAPFDVNASVTLYETVAVEEPAFFGNVSVCEVTTVAPQSVTLLGERGTLIVLTAYCTSAPWDHDNPQSVCDCAIGRMESAIANYATLSSTHQDAWGALWEHGLEVDVHEPPSSDGSPQDAMPDLNDAVVGSLYGLLSSLHESVPYSTSPGGLSTNGYRGHTFWDMETWMFPNLVLFYPSIAYGSAFRYRLNRMGGALNNAATVVGGAEGSAAFPWESAFSGYDVCPWSQGEHSEIHVTADVVLAWRMFFYVTLNDTFLSEAFPLLNATSFYWLSRCAKNATTGAWDLDGVTPPDEYHFGNNSVYTNAAVRLAVNFTLEAADRLGVALQSAYRAQLEDLAANLVILYDPVSNYHPEFAGYNGESQVKQADVILLNFPMGFQPLDPSTAANDLLYYENRTDPGGPAMTWSMFAVGYLSLPPNVSRATNATEKGLYYLGRGYQQNTFPPYYQWYEVAGGSGCPNFLTGAGGFLQSIWAGLVQLRVVGAGQLTILSTATLPSGINATTLSGLHIADSVLNITLSRHSAASNLQVTLLLTTQGPRHMISVNGLTLRLLAPVVFDVLGDGQDVAIRAEPLGP